MGNKIVYRITQEDFNNYKETYEELKYKKLPEIKDNIKFAKELGDLSENAEYEVALRDFEATTSRLSKLDEILNNYEIIDNSVIDTDTVSIYCKVTLLDLTDNITETFTVTEEPVSDPLNYRLSIKSPVGMAIMNKQVNDIITVETPYAKTAFKIVSISV